jgi:hypothetical protein
MRAVSKDDCFSVHRFSAHHSWFYARYDTRAAHQASVLTYFRGESDIN